MKRLRVGLFYRSSDLIGSNDPDANVTLPVKVLDADGTVLDEESASSSQPAEMYVPDDTVTVYVRLTWPSGRTETKRADLSDTNDAWLAFSDAAIARNEWAAWAVPKLNPQTPLSRPEAPADLGMDEFNNVWLRLWRFQGGVWQREKLHPNDERRSNLATQMDLELGKSPWLLQVGGSNVTWRFVALPGGGRARVLITPRDSKDPRADKLKVVVTSFRERAETLLEFLSRDDMRSVKALTESASFAKHLLSEKFEDPVAAVAGAYYLLRFNRWDSVPLRWFENLSANFNWIPDTAIVHCARLLRSGSETHSKRFSPDALFKQVLSRGWPVYAEGISLLQEAASLLKPYSNAEQHSFIGQIEALGAARAWAGAATSFYGRVPHTPEALQWVGKPRAPRRHKIIPQLIKSRSVDQAGLSLVENIRVSRSFSTDSQTLIDGLSQPYHAEDFRPFKRIVRDDEEFLIGNIARPNSF
ncbi:MAG: hypothetical protein ACK4FF_10435 [Limnobacter sp.]|uniref:hypothetical protein n=1 Tax=Limnobacter sp. TaxID=2003368 RepID=UPI0039195E31